MVVILWNNVKMSHLILTLCLLGNFHDFLSYADFFQNQFLKKNSFGNITSVKTVWILNQADLGPNCLQKFSAADTSRQ